MSEADSIHESELGVAEDADVGERAWGWIRVGVLATAIVAGPVWMLCTTIVIQLSPALNGTQGITDGGVPEVQAVTLGAWIQAVTMVATYMLFALPFVLAAITLGRFAWEAMRLRSEAERARYDAMVRGDAVIDDPAWREDG